MAVFDDMQKAAEAVAGIIAAHVVPCTLEFLDNNTIVRVDDYTKAGLPRDAAAILLIEVDGHPAQVADEAVVVERVLQQTGAVAVHVAKDAAENRRQSALPQRRRGIPLPLPRQRSRTPVTPHSATRKLVSRRFIWNVSWNLRWKDNDFSIWFVGEVII